MLAIPGRGPEDAACELEKRRTAMLTIDAGSVRRFTEYRPLIEAIREMFAGDAVMPVRQIHTVEVPGEADAALLIKPAWTVGAYIGVKLLTLFPGNADRGMESINAAYLLFDGRNGQVLAMVDGNELTARRTAAASALAADYLARADAKHMLMVGTGRLAPNLIAAHMTVRPISRITVWGRNPDKAAAAADGIARTGMEAHAADDLDAAVAEADIISCATLASEPLVHGRFLKPGAHLDLVGSYAPTMREADDDAVRRATVFCDTREGAPTESGDLIQPMKSGVLSESGIAADLYELCRGEHPGRTSDDEITFFKSTGAALEDLAGALLVYEQATRE